MRSAVNEDTTTSATKEDPDIPDLRDEKFYLHPQLHLRLWRERRPCDRRSLSSVPGTNVHCYDGLIIFPQIFLHTCSRSRFRSVFRVPRSQIQTDSFCFSWPLHPRSSVLKRWNCQQPSVLTSGIIREWDLKIQSISQDPTSRSWIPDLTKL